MSWLSHYDGQSGKGTNMKNQNGYTLVELMVVLALIASVAFGGFLIWIGWHFVSKFW